MKNNPESNTDWRERFNKQFEEVILDQELRRVIPGIQIFIQTTIDQEVAKAKEQLRADLWYVCRYHVGKDAMREVDWAAEELIKGRTAEELCKELEEEN